MSSLRRLMTTTAPVSVILIRVVVGNVFLSEGIQRFFPNELGAGRFAKIGSAGSSGPFFQRLSNSRSSSLRGAYFLLRQFSI